MIEHGSRIASFYFPPWSLGYESRTFTELLRTRSARMRRIGAPRRSDIIDASRFAALAMA
jgi:hypothetical protein